jgi:hypothetical protein
MRRSPPVRLPVSYCLDDEVQRWIEHEMSLITPYSMPWNTKSAVEVFQAARARLGDFRCWDLVIQQH